MSIDRLAENPAPLQVHREAEKLMDQLDLAERSGDQIMARTLYMGIASLEHRCFDMISDADPRTRAIIGNSAVSTYFKGGDYNNAMKLAQKILADPALAGQGYYLEEIAETVKGIRKIIPPSHLY